MSNRKVRAKRFKRLARNRERELRLQLDSERFAAERKYEQLINSTDTALRAARVARDTVRVDMDSMYDPRENSTRYRARLDIMNKRADTLYYEYLDDGRQADSIEREAFVKYVAEKIARAMLEPAMQKWRSR